MFLGPKRNSRDLRRIGPPNPFSHPTAPSRNEGRPAGPAKQSNETQLSFKLQKLSPILLLLINSLHGLKACFPNTESGTKKISSPEKKRKRKRTQQRTKAAGFSLNDTLNHRGEGYALKASAVSLSCCCPMGQWTGEGLASGVHEGEGWVCRGTGPSKNINLLVLYINHHTVQKSL